MPEGSLYDRDRLVTQLESETAWDVLIIGGGATGLGIALDAASRGFKTVLFEKYDFAKGTSSRSTKLVHGGVRYLAQGDIKLVYTALHEREVLAKNAAHVVKKQSFIIPCYTLWDVIKYSFGLRLYDILAGGAGFGWSKFIGRKKILRRLPNLRSKGLKGGVEYYDGQFDDSRLAVNIAQTAIEAGAVVLNYFDVTGLLKENGMVAGAHVSDVETRKQFRVNAKCVVNATGVFVDDILKLDNVNAQVLVRPSQGVHVVIDRRFLDSASALLIPKTRDGRVLFAVPWHDHTIVGTTDTPLDHYSIEPAVTEHEVAFILETVNQYLQTNVTSKDTLSVFAGLRPLAASSGDSLSTKELSRDHKLVESASGLVTITGGKWTTYREMAEKTVDLVARKLGNNAVCKTKSIAIHGSRPASNSVLSGYGTDEDLLIQIAGDDESMNALLVNGHSYTKAEVVWAIRNEMARTIDDVLARRLRLLFLDADAAISAAPAVAAILSDELKWSDGKKEKELSEFYKIAYHYTLNR